MIDLARFLPAQCQIVLFSATYKDEVREFAERVVPNANMISLKREELSVDAIKQLYLDCPSADAKYDVLCSIYGLCNIGQSIIFCHVRLVIMMMIDGSAAIPPTRLPHECNRMDIRLQ
jgi:ATP-dependent RNA helicase DDX19/DBP5